jgi:hypothetical protein
MFEIAVLEEVFCLPSQILHADALPQQPGYGNIAGNECKYRWLTRSKQIINMTAYDHTLNAMQEDNST